MLWCVPNISEGRGADVLGALTAACGPTLVDVHSDADHHRSVFTLAGPEDGVEHATRDLAAAVAEHVDLRRHQGVHPRLGALDVVPFVAPGTDSASAAGAALRFAAWIAETLEVPVFWFGTDHASLPRVRREAFTTRPPDLGPAAPHPTMGAVTVGVRPALVAVNCTLDRDDLSLARRIAAAVRERDGGLPGVRALGFHLASRARAQVSMNVTRLEACGVERACTEVRGLARRSGADATVELVGLVPKAEFDRWSDEFRAWSGVTSDRMIETQLEHRS
jgi:glutamate formiminotransferase